MTTLSDFDPLVSEGILKFIKNHTSENRTRKIAIFDADGTLWSGDVGEYFFQYQIKSKLIPHLPPTEDPWEFYWNEVKNGDVRKAYGWLAQWNADVPEKKLTQWTKNFFDNQYKPRIFKPIQNLIQKLYESGFKIWVVSGSMKWIVQAGIKHFKIKPHHIITTEVVVKNGILTDKLLHPVPYREVKAQLIQQKIGIKPLFVAGNTYWDKDMMELATEMTLAVSSEKKNESNFKAEQKLQKYAKSKHGKKVIWLRAHLSQRLL